MARFVIHIGPYKTGSTYLQQCLREKAVELQSAGIILPHFWEESAFKPSHTGLIARLVTERRAELEPVFAAWKQSDLQTIVISCEDLSAMSREYVKALMLRELIGDAPATIVFYVRRWSTLLSSEWKEYVKQGSQLSLLEVMAHNLRDAIKSRIINVDACLSVYRDLFGIDSIKIVAYDEVLESGANQFQHFAEAILDYPTLGPQTSKTVNRSLTASQTELMRLFNVLGAQTGIDSSRLLRFFYLEHLPSPLRNVLSRLDDLEASIDLSDDDPAVRAVLEDNRRRYAICALPPVSDVLFNRPRQVQMKFIRSDYALIPGFGDRIRSLWHSLLDVERPR